MAKVLISLPDDLLAVVDAAAKAQTKSRSGLIRDALRRYVAQGSGAERNAAIRRLRRSFAPLEGNPEEIIRAERSR